MAGFRDKIIYSIAKGAGILPSSFLLNMSNQSMILPFYHAISDRDMPHIQNLYAVKGVKAFSKDLDFLLKHFTPLDYPDFVDLTRQNSKPKRPSFLLSFDDGLSEFYDVIAPILLKKGVPAVCFLNSHFIDNKELFFRYKESLLIDQLKKDPPLQKEIAAMFNNTDSIVDNILSIKYQNRVLLDDLAQKMGISFKAFLEKEQPYLTSDQIRSLIKQGFYFGAHSIDHPEYQYLGLGEQLRQTKTSVDHVCKSFALDYKIFAFPFTDYKVSQKYFDEIKDQEIAEYTFGGAGLKKDTALNNFQRIPFEMRSLSGKQILNSELLYYLLKIPFGKNKIRRA